MVGHIDWHDQRVCPGRTYLIRRRSQSNLTASK
jgi:hypothetical protein